MPAVMLAITYQSSSCDLSPLFTLYCITIALYSSVVCFFFFFLIFDFCFVFFFFQAEDGIRDVAVTGVQTCALPICFQSEVGDAFERPFWSGASEDRICSEFSPFGGDVDEAYVNRGATSHIAVIRLPVSQSLFPFSVRQV